MRTIPKPAAGEYPPYAAMYLDLLPDDGRVLAHLEDQARLIDAFFRALPADRLRDR